MNQRKLAKRKLSLSKETLLLVTGGIQTTSALYGSCAPSCRTCGTFCGGCPRVTQDWPSCGPAFCTDNLTVIECGIG